MPKIPKRKKSEDKTEDEEEEEIIIMLYHYILQMVLILGGKDSEKTREQIVDIMVLSAQLQEVGKKIVCANNQGFVMAYVPIRGQAGIENDRN